MPKVAPESVEDQTTRTSKASLARLGQELIECWPSFRDAADNVVEVLSAGPPATSLDVSSEFGELVFRLLVRRADPSVDGAAHFPNYI